MKLHKRIRYLRAGENVTVDGWYFFDETSSPTGPYKDAWQAAFELGRYTEQLEQGTNNDTANNK